MFPAYRYVIHSYIHFAQERILIIMVNSDLHEVAAVIIHDLLRGAMDKQDALNPPLINAWQLHTNRSAWFNDRQGNHYISDMTLFFMPPL